MMQRSGSASPAGLSRRWAHERHGGGGLRYRDRAAAAGDRGDDLVAVMIGAPNHFAHEHKSAATYLDVAANDHGDEKGLPVHRALRRIESTEPHIAEISPGGGAAVDYLATRAAEDPRLVRLTLVEAPGVSSASLTDAIARFNAVGSCVLVHGWAQDIGRLLREPVDVISASALMHEVYSYGGALTATARPGHADTTEYRRARPEPVHPHRKSLCLLARPVPRPRRRLDYSEIRSAGPCGPGRDRQVRAEGFPARLACPPPSSSAQ